MHESRGDKEALSAAVIFVAAGTVCDRIFIDCRIVGGDIERSILPYDMHVIVRANFNIEFLINVIFVD